MLSVATSDGSPGGRGEARFWLGGRFRQPEDLPERSVDADRTCDQSDLNPEDLVEAVDIFPESPVDVGDGKELAVGLDKALGELEGIVGLGFGRGKVFSHRRKQGLGMRLRLSFVSRIVEDAVLAEGIFVTSLAVPAGEQHTLVVHEKAVVAEGSRLGRGVKKLDGIDPFQESVVEVWRVVECPFDNRHLGGLLLPHQCPGQEN